MTGSLTDELRVRFNAFLKKADPKYRRSQASVPVRVQHIILGWCKDFGERCAFRRYLLERFEMPPEYIVPERDLQHVNAGERGAYT